jgi:simple sugar transport system permease protein
VGEIEVPPEATAGSDTAPPPETEAGRSDGGGGETPPPSNGSSFFADLTGVNAVDWQSLVIVPLLAIVSALLVSGFIILITDIDLWRDFSLSAVVDSLQNIGNAYKALFVGSFGSLRAISETLTNSSILILAGLSVAVGFRAGMFNIGTEGQILIGGMAAVWAGFVVDLPIFLHLPFVILAGAVAGGIWGGIPGLLKARTGAHEVIVTIMMNQIAILLVLYLLQTTLFQLEGRTDPVSKTVPVSGRLPRLLGFLDRSDIRVHAGMILALAAAYFVYWLLFKSTIGYEFRSVGFNPDASRYGGMKVTSIFFWAMAVAGAMGGLAGVDAISGVLYRGTDGFSAGVGFEGISVALLGRSHPAGVVLAGLLFGALRAGGQEMQVQTDVSIDLILVVQALVIGFLAAPALIRAIYRVKGGGEGQQVAKGWAA